ncbi:MAG: hypothetical protein F9K25_06305 [Candidatus Contendobacter sp.]|nr:MAG: hypothetical protein F9K25_06305 [Candidatus Contendobacter sp.]
MRPSTPWWIGLRRGWNAARCSFAPIPGTVAKGSALSGPSTRFWRDPAGRERLAASGAALVQLDAARAAAIAHAQCTAERADELGRLETTIRDVETAIGLAESAPISLPRSLPPPELAAGSGWRRWLAPWRRFWRLRRLRRLSADWAQLGLPEPDGATLDRFERRLEDLRALERLREERSRLEAEIRQSSSTEATPDPVALGEQIQNSARACLMELSEILAECPPENRQALTGLRGDLALARSEGAAGAAHARERWSAQRDLILQQFPLWAASNLGVASRIPLAPGLFDYVVLDEAAQCDIASALPLLARARRAIIIGDPAQLTHVTQVRPEWEADALRAAGLLAPGIGRFTFSANSLFHFAAAAAGDHHLLRDHFRCHDDIADYISETFYGHRLRPLTDARVLRPPPGKTAGFHWTEARGPIQPARTGLPNIASYPFQVILQMHVFNPSWAWPSSHRRCAVAYDSGVWSITMQFGPDSKDEVYLGRYDVGIERPYTATKVTRLKSAILAKNAGYCSAV